MRYLIIVLALLIACNAEPPNLSFLATSTIEPVVLPTVPPPTPAAPEDPTPTIIAEPIPTPFSLTEIKATLTAEILKAITPTVIPTPIPTATRLPEPTNTPQPIITPKPESTPIPTQTPTPTSTPRPTPTPIPTATPIYWSVEVPKQIVGVGDRIDYSEGPRLLGNTLILTGTLLAGFSPSYVQLFQTERAAPQSNLYNVGDTVRVGGRTGIIGKFSYNTVQGEWGYFVDLIGGAYPESYLDLVQVGNVPKCDIERPIMLVRRPPDRSYKYSVHSTRIDWRVCKEGKEIGRTTSIVPWVNASTWTYDSATRTFTVRAVLSTAALTLLEDDSKKFVVVVFNAEGEVISRKLATQN